MIQIFVDFSTKIGTKIATMKQMRFGQGKPIAGSCSVPGWIATPFSFLPRFTHRLAGTLALHAFEISWRLRVTIAVDEPCLYP